MVGLQGREARLRERERGLKEREEKVCEMERLVCDAHDALTQCIEQEVTRRLQEFKEVKSSPPVLLERPGVESTVSPTQASPGSVCNVIYLLHWNSPPVPVQPGSDILVFCRKANRV